MARVLIVYGSTTGNTERVAELVETQMRNHRHDVEVKNVVDANIGELGNGYELTVLGSSTWGEDEIEFQDDFASFYEGLDAARQLDGKKVALFGCGDSSYTHFCGAVDLLEEKMGDLGAQLIGEPLRIDGDPEDAVGEINSWAAELCEAVR